MADMETTILSKVLDWAWAICAFFIGWVFKIMFDHGDQIRDLNTRVLLINQHNENEQKERAEESRRRDIQRKEMMDQLDQYHKEYMENNKQLMHKLGKLYSLFGGGPN